MNKQAIAVEARKRVAFSFLGPLLALFIVITFLPFPDQDRFTEAVPLAAVGVVSWILGLRWYGLKEGLGLRGHRPLYASIGFAALGWTAFLIVRFVTVANEGYGSGETGSAFLYLLLFEAFCVQLWVFGVFFRAVSDWRGPLTATIAGGILFGLVAFFFFEEASLVEYTSLQAVNAFLYFCLWGIFLSIVRLRTGSILGIVIIQAMQSLTAWDVMTPISPLPAQQLLTLYLVTAPLYMLLIWRLWPKREEDYRV